MFVDALQSIVSVLPVASGSCVSSLTLVAQQLSFFTQVAGGAEAFKGAMVTLGLLLDSVVLSQSGEREKEEERTEPSYEHVFSPRTQHLCPYFYFPVLTFVG